MVKNKMSTIASISTAPGVGGIGIIRMSGENCFEILEKIFVPIKKEKIEKIKGYTIKYGYIEEKGEKIDEVLVSYFKSPKSYTTENMCEINAHGGNIVVKKILELCLKNGAQLAEPGEFTKRAFLNGRIDLSQAEAVIDIIDAKSEREANEGIKQLDGYLSKEINEIKQLIMNELINIEVSIDYPEYDEIEEVSNKKMENILNEVKIKLKKLEKSFDNGKIIKEGIKTAIIGKPNAGKSSLLNNILKEERAIVTDIEGTTRDTIEEFAIINGIPIKLIDTAGIRKTENKIEKIGIEKAREIALSADLIILIFDISKELNNDDLELLELIKNKKSIILLNKCDLKNKIIEDDARLIAASKNILKISIKDNIGIEKIEETISEIFRIGDIQLENDVIITNVRHKNLISIAINNTEKAIKQLKDNIPIDIATISIKDILENLGEITGDVVTEDIINEIFSKFCLGK